MQIWNYLDIQFRLSETKLTDKILFGGVGSWCAGARLNLLWQSKEKKCSINQLKKNQFQYPTILFCKFIMMKRNKQAVQLTAQTSLFITLARNHNYNAKALFVCLLLTCNCHPPQTSATPQYTWLSWDTSVYEATLVYLRKRRYRQTWN